MSNITIVVGAQWGDEGKGKITDYFGQSADYVVRTHGGNNAGHTLVVGNETYKLHHIPSGILYPDVVSVIGNGVVINPKILLEEINGLKERGLKINLKISQRAHIITPCHIMVDEILSLHQGELAAGSTKRGIAAVYADKAYRHGIRMIDLLEPDFFKKKLKVSYYFNKKLIETFSGQAFSQSFESVYSEYSKYAKQLEPYVTDTSLELYKAYQSGKKMVFEGAQGMSLDPDQGMYPFTTSSNNTAPYAGVGAGIGINQRNRIIGVVKAYLSRVGQSPFITELFDGQAKLLRDKGNEYGTTTGRPRRVGWLDLVQIRQSARTSGLTDIAITKLDVLGGYPEIKICTAYKCKGEYINEMPASLSVILKAKPVYETLKGWDELSSKQIEDIVSRGFSALPKTMKAYIKFIEENVSVPATIISLGPKRKETLIRD